MDLRGPVHTTLMEIFDYVIDPKGTSAGSVFSVYDLEGYILEENRYDPHGSLIVHRKYTRSGSEIFKLQHMSAAPGESRTTVQSFNADGLVAETDTYDGNDALNSRIVNDYAQPPRKQQPMAQYRQQKHSTARRASSQPRRASPVAIHSFSVIQTASLCA
jgi:hypothetical protein